MIQNTPPLEQRLANCRHYHDQCAQRLAENAQKPNPYPTTIPWVATRSHVGLAKLDEVREHGLETA